MIKFVAAMMIALGLLFFIGCLEPPHPGPPSPTPIPPGPGPGPGPNPPGPGPGPTPDPDDNTPAPSSDIGGTVKKVIDGDTITAKVRGTLLPVTFHLYGIDAPELEQKWGDRSRNYLQHMVDETGRSVTFRIMESNGRRSKVAWLTLKNGFVFNCETVRMGWAWEKDSGTEELRSLQEQAEKLSYGMWADSSTVEEPWMWRSDQGITEEVDKGVYDTTNTTFGAEGSK